MTDSRISFQSNFDCELVDTNGGSCRNLLIEIKSNEKDTANSRVPLNLAIVIDVSTSMRGSRLAYAKEAAIGVIESLTETDYLSIVSFGNDVKVHLAGNRQDKRGKQAAIDVVSNLEHRIYTNLSGGWLEGAACVAAVMEEVEKVHSHVVLLSDGHANVGILDPLIITKHADELRMRGVYTSTVGIGDNYSSILLRQLADFSGGRMHDAEHAEEIVDVLRGELNELRTTAFEDLSLRVLVPDGVVIDNISQYPERGSDLSKIISIGALPKGGTRKVLLRIFTPEGKKKETVNFETRLIAKEQGSSKSVSAVAEASLIYAYGKAFEARVLNESVALSVAELWHAAVVRRAAQYNREGNFGALARFLEHELLHFVDYTQPIPQAKPLAEEISLLLENRSEEWEERLRKEMEITSYKTLTTSLDYRPRKRERWSSTM